MAWILMLTEYTKPETPIKALFRRIFQILPPWVSNFKHLKLGLRWSVELTIVLFMLQELGPASREQGQ
jgi:hypothetical protein